MITVAIVEDNAQYRESLAQVVDCAPGLKCICNCGTAEEALRLIPRNPPDVVLMDVHLPNRSGIECTARLKEALPELAVIILTVFEDTETLFRAVKAGASGYLLKRALPEQILAGIEEVHRGGAPMNSEMARKLLNALHERPQPQPLVQRLSRREQEILELLSRGLANREIAEHLSLSIETVRVHLRHIYEKFHVRSRTEAVAKFMGARVPGKSGDQN